jgi:uncharacterized membrane protein YfcA
MHTAAATGQFILFTASFVALLVFHHKKIVSFQHLFFIAPIMAVSAFFGGYFSHIFSELVLKLIFAGMLILAGIILLFNITPREEKAKKKRHHSYIVDKLNFNINIIFVITILVITGIGSGMVGTAGGSFVVPLLVYISGMNLKMAIGTSSALISSTAFMGFSGHLIRGNFNISWMIPLALIAIIGGFIGGKFAIGTNKNNLKLIFSYSNFLAAGLMIINAIILH